MGPCGKSGCGFAATGAASCPHCIARTYRFCDHHGGEAAARRSLKSHIGLYHPGGEKGGHQIVSMVYVDFGTENDEAGAVLMRHPDEQALERTRDTVLINASTGKTDSDAQGIVAAYLGVDGHWHFLRYLTRSELKAGGVL